MYILYHETNDCDYSKRDILGYSDNKEILEKTKQCLNDKYIKLVLKNSEICDRRAAAWKIFYEDNLKFWLSNLEAIMNPSREDGLWAACSGINTSTFREFTNWYYEINNSDKEIIHIIPPEYVAAQRQIIAKSLAGWTFGYDRLKYIDWSEVKGEMPCWYHEDEIYHELEGYSENELFIEEITEIGV